MRLPRRFAAIALVAAAAVAACGGGSGASAPAAGSLDPASPAPSGSGSGPSVYPVIVSTQQVVGANRFVFSFLDPGANTPVATPDREAAVAFVPPGSTIAGDPIPGTFVWAIEGSRGVYVVTTDFPVAGDWTAVFRTALPGDTPEAIAFQFTVLEEGTVLPIGAKAPAERTPTLADVGGEVAKVSTDARPEPRFYETSVDAALAAGEPFVLVFATPAFCQSAQCGPTLDRVKAVAAGYPELTFINVEPYELAFTEGRLQPVLSADGYLQAVPASDAFGLVSEPWIFVIDGGGAIRGSFEGVVGEGELRAAIDAVTG